MTIKNSLWRLGLAVALPVLVGACSPPPKGDAAASRTLEVSAQVPDAGWSLQIEKVYRVGDELWVVADLNSSSGMAAQVISTASDSITAPLPDLPERVFVTGKTWNWQNEEPHTFLRPGEEPPSRIEEGKVLYSRSGS